MDNDIVNNEGVVTAEQLHRLKQKRVEEPDLSKVDDYLFEPLSGLAEGCNHTYSSESAVEKILRLFKNELFTLYAEDNDGKQPARTLVNGGYWLHYANKLGSYERGDFSPAEALLLARAFEGVNSFAIGKAGRYLWQNIKIFHDEMLKNQLMLLRKQLHQISSEDYKINSLNSSNVHTFRDLIYIINNLLTLPEENHQTHHSPEVFLMQQQFNKKINQAKDNIDFVLSLSIGYHMMFEQHRNKKEE